MASAVPKMAAEAVLVKSDELPEEIPACVGYDFNNGIDYDAMFEAYHTTGFQATSFAQAVDTIRRMISWRLSDEPIADDDLENMRDPAVRDKVKCKIFLGYTSNMVSCGIREVIRYLVQHKMVDVLVTTAGAVEEDLMKCMAPHRMGDFQLSGAMLRSKGLNRIGNLLVPNDNYCKFEDWTMPILDQILLEQQEQQVVWSPAKLCARFGKEINNEESVCYWAWKNDIPMYCPAITDGSVGDMLFFHSYNHPGIVIDILQDLKTINEHAMKSPKTGMIILGGGVVKHHICNANLMRNGADFSVFVNTASEWDGSDAGARPDEAVSWGKIRANAKAVKVYGDASLIFPLLVAQTFAKSRKQE